MVKNSRVLQLLKEYTELIKERRFWVPNVNILTILQVSKKRKNTLTILHGSSAIFLTLKKNKNSSHLCKEGFNYTKV